MAVWTPSQQDLDNIEQWASEGKRDYEYAALLGFTAGWFVSLKKKYPAIRIAISKGKSKAKASRTARMFQISLDPTHPREWEALVFVHKYLEEVDLPDLPDDPEENTEDKTIQFIRVVPDKKNVE